MCCRLFAAWLAADAPTTFAAGGGAISVARIGGVTRVAEVVLALADMDGYRFPLDGVPCRSVFAN